MKSLWIANILIFSGCISTSPRVTQNFSFRDTNPLVLGTTSEQNIVDIWGKPQTEIETPANHRMHWSYYDARGFQRMTLSFDSQTKTLVSILWIPDSAHDESSPPKVLELFPNSHFKKHKIQFDVADMILSRTFFIDNETGISVETDWRIEKVKYVIQQKPGTIEEMDGFVKIPPPQESRVLVDRRSQPNPSTQQAN